MAASWLDDRAIHETLVEMGADARRERLVAQAVAKISVYHDLARLTDEELSALSAALLARLGEDA